LTERLECNGISAPDEWELYAGADKTSAVNSPDDDDTSDIRGPVGSPPEQQRYSLAASAIPAGSTINTVSVSTRAKSSGAEGGLIQGLELGGNTTESAPIVTGGGSVWATTATALARPGGGAWTLADLASLEVYIKAITGSTYTYVTTIFVEISYTPPSTGPMLLLF